jgi:hypothetical protein
MLSQPMARLVSRFGVVPGVSRRHEGELRHRPERQGVNVARWRKMMDEWKESVRSDVKRKVGIFG